MCQPTELVTVMDCASSVNTKGTSSVTARVRWSCMPFRVTRIVVTRRHVKLQEDMTVPLSLYMFCVLTGEVASTTTRVCVVGR